MPTNSPAALVTGCAGFIGSNLTERLLAEGYRVVGVDCFTDYYARQLKERNLAYSREHPGFRLLEADLVDLQEFPEVDYVFHQAAQAGVRGSWGAAFDTYLHHNILATQRLLEFYKGRQLRKFVYASSSSVYGDAEGVMREERPLHPVSPYGVTKLAGEHLCTLYAKSYGMPTISLRYFTVYGPRQRPDMAINKFVRALLDGTEITIFGDGEQTRDFTYVADVVEANFRASQSGLVGASLNVGGGSPISVNGLIRMLEAAAGKKARVRHVEQQKGDVAHTWADIGRAQVGLGWQPGTELEKGLRQYLEWVAAA